MSAEPQRSGSDSKLFTEPPTLPSISSAETLTRSVLKPALTSYLRGWKRVVGKKVKVPEGCVGLKSLFRGNIPLDRFLLVILLHLVLQQERCCGRPLSLEASRAHNNNIGLAFAKMKLSDNSPPEVMSSLEDTPSDDKIWNLDQTLWSFAVDFLSCMKVDIVSMLHRRLCPHDFPKTGAVAVYLFGEALKKMTPKERATAVDDVVQHAVRPELVNDATDLRRLRWLLTLCLNPDPEQRSKAVIDEVLRATEPCDDKVATKRKSFRGSIKSSVAFSQQKSSPRFRFFRL
ncbi:MAG: hypothetical protein KVP17_004390 [Porospora cf. gigantea B]|uniref:uncharacterized protein n=1 Tax=Porospora cf. gigantea B TaxID=2853592 RepID=UPI003571803A|nr:MAG: hypothetical protein KVP17_004390 [Porospora cf. gigantea B]